jgi:flagellar hook-basal body complex protein FliE
MKEFLSVAMDNAILKEKLSKALEVNEIDTNNDSEAFTKFLSQSRDWAFEYIEDAQEKIIKMVSDVEYDIKNFQNFTSSHDQSSNVVLLNKFIKHYDELKKMIPKDPDA